MIVFHDQRSLLKISSCFLEEIHHIQIDVADHNIDREYHL